MTELLDRASIEKWLFNAFSPPADYLSQVQNLYLSTEDTDLRGIAGFQLFIVAASDPSSTTLEMPDAYLRDRSVIRYLYDKYCHLPPKWQEQLTVLRFHKFGTTSFILQSDEEYALKIIQPKFRNTPTITEATKSYKENFRFIGRYAPKIHDSDEAWILMDFVSGQTLTEFIQKYMHIPSEPSKSIEQLELVKQVMEQLCDALTMCLATYHISHLDLSPNNIIVTYSQGRISELHLIDFGINYLLQEHVGNVGALSRAQTFISPELQGTLARGDEKSDVFSVGMILLEMLGVGLLEKETLSLELDNAWLRNPDIAGVIEGLIDANAPHRLLNLSQGGTVFDAVKSKVVESVKVTKIIQMRNNSLFWMILEIVFSVFPFQSIYELYLRWRAAKGAEIEKNQLFLVGWAILVQFIHIVVLCCFVWLLLVPHELPFFSRVAYDKRLCDHFGSCILPANVPPLPFWTGALAGRINGFLPGRLVALSFSIIVAQYYANIFATVSFRGVRLNGMLPMVAASEFLMRAVPIIGSFPIFYALIVDPKAWPYCSASGLLFVCLNNGLCYWINKRITRTAKNEGLYMRPSPFMHSAQEEFFEWWPQILHYVITLAIVGFLLSKGLAKDEWLYALFVSVAINLVMMLRVNCRNQAPTIRTMLHRVTWWLRRVQEKRVTQAGLSI